MAVKQYMSASVRHENMARGQRAYLCSSHIIRRHLPGPQDALRVCLVEVKIVPEAQQASERSRDGRLVD